MKKIVISIFICWLLGTQTVFAHVVNEETIYNDVKLSEAKDAILWLRGINVIGYEEGANLYHPQELLTKEDVAFWAATFHGLISDHHPSKEEGLKQALSHGLLASLEGNATYEDINQAYFDGKLTMKHPNKTLTKEEFALFMNTYITTPVNGKTLLDQAGFQKGPTGKVEKVIEKQVGTGEEAYNVYSFVIKGETYPVSEHPKVLHGDVDLTTWKGKTIASSWIGKEDENGKELGIIVAKASNEQTISSTKPIEKTPIEEKKPLPLIPIIGIVVVLALLFWLFGKKKK